MQLYIHDKMTLGDISRSFQSLFPYLKLCFYKRPKNWTGESYLQYQLDDDVLCNEYIKKIMPLEFQIEPQEKTMKFEIRFKTHLSLNVQLFRKYKERWIQSDGSDALSLVEQNNLGERDAFEL